MTIRESLDKRVNEIGKVRAIAFYLLLVIIMIAGLALLNVPALGARFAQAAPAVAICLIVGAGVLATDFIDRTVFSSRIRCPACDGSLWPYLTKGLKRRRFRLPREITNCPLCGVDFSTTLAGDETKA